MQMSDVRCCKNDARWCGNPKAVTKDVESGIAGMCHRPPRISPWWTWNASNTACLKWVQKEKVHATFPNASKCKLSFRCKPKLIFMCLHTRMQNQANRNSGNGTSKQLTLTCCPGVFQNIFIWHASAQLSPFHMCSQSLVSGAQTMATRSKGYYRHTDVRYQML